MQRVLVALLLACLLGMSTGAVSYWHESAHAHATVQDEDHCAVHATLTAPSLPASYVPLLVSLGLFIAFLSELQLAMPARRPAFRIDCRGPPAAV